MRILTHSFILVLCLLLVTHTRVQATPIVLPDGFAAVEGDQTLNTLMFNGPQTVQQAYSAAEVAAVGITVGSIIKSMAWRLDGNLPNNPISDLEYNNFEITLSKSNNAPNALSLTFADNIGGDAVVARSGPLTIPALSMPGGGAPNDFGFVVEFSTPYVYNGGDLLLMYTHDGNNLATFSTDGINTSSERFIHTVEYDATSGTEFKLRDIVQFHVAVPEPSSLALSAMGFLALAAWCWRRRFAG